MKTINLRVPVEVVADVDIDRKILAELGLEDHIDTFEKSDVSSLLEDRELFHALTDIIEARVNERLGTTDLYFEEARTEWFFNFTEDYVKEVA